MRSARDSYRRIRRTYGVTLISAVLLLVSGTLPAQTVEGLRFDHLTVEDGLSQGVISAMLHDRDGFMWFGTGDGLNRFDGYSFVEYRSERGNPFSLGDNAITALAEDTAGNIWIGTRGGGIHRYYPAARVMLRIPHAIPTDVKPGSMVVNAMCFDERGVLWIGTDGEGLLAYHPKDSTVIHYMEDGDNGKGLSTDRITVIARADSSHIWVGGAGRYLNLLDTRSGSIERYRVPAHAATVGFGPAVTGIAVRDENTVWISTANAVLRLDRRTATFRALTAGPAAFQGPVRDIMLDSRGRLWIGTDEHGISVYYPEQERFERITATAAGEGGLVHTGIRTLYEDRIGNVWIGTNGNGVQFASPAAKAFSLLRSRPGDPASISIRSFRAIYQGRDSLLWIGGYGGLNRVDRSTGEVYIFPREDRIPPPGVWTRGLHNTTIHTLHPDPERPERYLYAGTEGSGAYRIDMRLLRAAHLRFALRPDSAALYGSVVYDITSDARGHIWFGTDRGLSAYDPVRKRYTHFVHDADDARSINAGAVRCLFLDRNGFLWIGTDRGGLGLYDPVTGDFTRFVHDPAHDGSLSSNSVYSITEDSGGILWIGTSRGLNRMDRQNTTFMHFGREDGFPNDVVYGILEDAEGHLWISTNRGIVRFHRYDGVLNTFDASDGLQGNEFNSAAYFAAESGELFFGGVNGLTHFLPRAIERNPYVPPIRITRCMVGSTEILPLRDARGNPYVEIDYTRETVTFEFAALSYYRPENNRYRYRLEGVHEQWVDAGHNRRITFVALSPGTYTLHIRGSNNDGVWNTRGSVIALHILPPYWGTWWFRLIIGVIVLAVGIGFFRWRVSIVRKQEIKLATTVEERTAELRHSNASLLQEIEERKRAEEEAYRANATKTEFLAHLSHEIRTPMNAILGFTEILADKITDPLQRSHLRSIEVSGNNLLRLINDILDLSKIEAGRIELELAAVNLRDLLREVEQVFEFQFRRKDLSYRLRFDDRIPPVLYLDELRTRQILFNLIGNAVKYTDAGTIIVEASLAAKHQDLCAISIAVRDSGVGIPPSQQDIIFEPFRQARGTRSSNARGTGLGLAITRRLLEIMGGTIHLESKLGQGSVFRITLPDIRCSEDAERVSDRTRPPVEDRVPEAELSPESVTTENASVEEQLTPDRRAQICRLCETLETQFHDRWEKVSRNYHIQEMEAFAADVQKEAAGAQYAPLQQWSARLLEEAANFDMERIPRTLERYAVLVQQLHERCREA